MTEFTTAGRLSLEIIIQCHVTVDLLTYPSLTGAVDFNIVFDGGGRTESIDTANHWNSGSNTVTFNSDISTQVSMQVTDTTSRLFLSIITMRSETFYYYSQPSSICNGGDINTGTFVFSDSELTM
jgi:hypothetical protein